LLFSPFVRILFPPPKPQFQEDTMPAHSYIPDQPAPMVHASLQRSLKAMEDAHQCAVLWFGEVMRRRLFRDLGHSSINQYAIQELGFSKSRTDDFVRLARRLENLPVIRKAVEAGGLGYTKAREIVSVATPDTQDTWLKAAKGTRRELVQEVKKAKMAAKVDPAQTELLPSSPPVVAPKEMPVRFQMDLTPEQEARRAALVERLHKLGGVPNDRAELMLEALAALLEKKELQDQKCPRGHFSSLPPVQIHVHESAGKMTRTPEMRCRCLHKWRPEHNNDSTPHTPGGPGPGQTPLPGTRLRQNPVPGSPPSRTTSKRRKQPGRKPGDPLWILSSAMARKGEHQRPTGLLTARHLQGHDLVRIFNRDNIPELVLGRFLQTVSKDPRPIGRPTRLRV
jgi:hypothetical protein